MQEVKVKNENAASTEETAARPYKAVFETMAQFGIMRATIGASVSTAGSTG